MYENSLSLPAPLVRACEEDDYDRGPDTWRTVTELIAPPRMVALEHAYPNQRTTEDVADMLWLLQGKAMHAVLAQSNATGIAEQRLTATIGGRVISGQLDHFELTPAGVLTDYKSTSVWTVIYQDRYPDWEAQLNCYAMLLALHDHEVSGVQVLAMLDGWSRSKAKKEPNYPQWKAVKVPFRLWSAAETVDYVLKRIALHAAAEEALANGQPLPHCTAKERWQDPPVWALMKAGRKSAVKLYGTQAEAQAACGAAPRHLVWVEYRPSLAKRCLPGRDGYCPMRTLCPTLNDGQFAPGDLGTPNGTGEEHVA
jgi:hypothetical protein